MKKQIVFIHGGDSFSNLVDFRTHLTRVPLRNLPGKQTSLHFTQTLAEDLGDDYEVFMPTMPNKQNADFGEWSIWFERHLSYLRDDITLIGWSLGGMFLAKYLSENKLPVRVGKLVLLAAPCGYCQSEDGNDCGNFQFDPSILQNIAQNTNQVFILHSKDDFVVPITAAYEYKIALPEA